MTSLLPLLPESPVLTVTLPIGGALPQAPGAPALDFAGLLDAVAAPPPETAAPGAGLVSAPALAVPLPGTLPASVVAGWPGGKNLPEPGAALPPALPLALPLSGQLSLPLSVPAQPETPDPLTGLVVVAPLSKTPAPLAQAAAPEAVSPAPALPLPVPTEVTGAALPAIPDRAEATLLLTAPAPVDGEEQAAADEPDEIPATDLDQPEDTAPPPLPAAAAMIAQPVAAPPPVPVVANAPVTMPAPAHLSEGEARMKPAAAPPNASAPRMAAARPLALALQAASDTGPASGAKSPAPPDRAPVPARSAAPAAAPTAAAVVGAGMAEANPAAAPQAESGPAPASALATAALLAADGTDLAAAGSSAAANTAPVTATSPVALPPASAPAAPLAAPLAERPADTRPSEARPQLESTIAQVGDIREALRAARPAMTLQHAEFGMVSLRLEQAAPDQWRAVLASRDPGFVPAVQAALETRTIAASGETATGFAGQQGASQNDRYGASPNGGQGSSQPYLGQSGQRDGEAAPDHRRPSTAAALAARGEGEAEDVAAFAPGSGGLFA